MKVLVIEDEKKLAEYLRLALTEHNYVVDVAMDGISGLHLARESQYDLILLDVMLPGMDGFSVLRELRKSDRVPVLMLTARDKIEDRVRGCATAPTTIWSSPSPCRSCWRACWRWAGAAARTRPRSAGRTCCAWAIWNWTCCAGAPRAAASGWT